ncbi:MAG: hypothetical protein AAFY47_05290 [Pseudomonadota bacterium]
MTNRTKIRHLRAACDFAKAGEFVALCDRSRDAVSAYLRGDTWPPAEVLVRIRNHLDRIKADYDPEWFIPAASHDQQQERAQ